MAHQRIVRHPRDAFSPGNKFVFMKRLRFNLPGYEFSAPGDPVTPRLIELIGRAKLKVWFDGGFIATHEYAIGVGIEIRDVLTENGPGKLIEKPLPKSQAKRIKASAGPVAKDEKKPVSMMHTGGGWYRVLYSDQSVKKVQGKKRAEALLKG